MPEMTEETYTALLEQFKLYKEQTDAKMSEMENKMNDMTNMFKANMTVNGSSTKTVDKEARRAELNKKLKESVK